MEADFVQAYEAYRERRRAEWTEEQAREYTRFALSNRERGKAFVQSAESLLNFDFRGKRVLDVGSAYGGFVIAAAARGAEAYGIELLGDLHDLALANAKGELGRITLLRMDFLDPSVPDAAGQRPFDLISASDVFEHIYDSTRLFRQIAKLSHQKTVVYFETPNGEAWTAIQREGHEFLFGLTLLDPGAYGLALDKCFSVYYRPLEFYQGRFALAGFNRLYLLASAEEIQASLRRVPEQFEALAPLVEKGPFRSALANEIALENFRLLRSRLERDLREGDALTICLLYDQHFWKGFASRDTQAALEKSSGVVRLDWPAPDAGAGSDSAPRSLLAKLLRRRARLRR